MKSIVLVFLIICSLYVFSCVNNDTSTKDPNGGYKERADSATSMSDSGSVPKDRGAVGVDTIKNGQAIISGATLDSSK